MYEVQVTIDNSQYFLAKSVLARQPQRAELEMIHYEKGVHKLHTVIRHQTPQLQSSGEALAYAYQFTQDLIVADIHPLRLRLHREICPEDLEGKQSLPSSLQYYEIQTTINVAEEEMNLFYGLTFPRELQPALAMPVRSTNIVVQFNWRISRNQSIHYASNMRLSTFNLLQQQQRRLPISTNQCKLCILDTANALDEGWIVEQ